MGVTAAGGLAGAAVATCLVDRVGPARMVLAGSFTYGVFGVPLLVAGPGPVSLAVVAAGTTQRSLRHHLCPPELQSRAQQTSVWLVTGLRPAAALTAGALAAAFSVHARRVTTLPTSAPTHAKDSTHGS
ncbi:major facilitator protein [Streptomyces laurentii]|uniref:Major facilitator protein n=1 Tax=Streptomyces laurentii TaxID=39478 RepID=A0A160P9R1_STRLU|nr:major facilitator protein [Streptomyces laurentii]